MVVAGSSGGPGLIWFSSSWTRSSTSSWMASCRKARLVEPQDWPPTPRVPARPASIEPMRRNASTVVVLAGPAPGEVLAALGRSMNVALIGPEEGTEGLAAAAEALQRAGRATSPYAIVPADPLAAVAASWRVMWDVSKQEGPAGFEQEAVKVLAAWRAGR